MGKYTKPNTALIKWINAYSKCEYTLNYAYDGVALFKVNDPQTGSVSNVTHYIKESQMNTVLYALQDYITKEMYYDAQQRNLA